MTIAVIGLGHQSTEDHLPAILSSDLFNLVGVVDADEALAARVGHELNVPYASSVDRFLAQPRPQPEVALVAVPHSQYGPIIENLAAAGVHVIKEKPFAVSVEEALTVKRLVADSGISLSVTLQRRFNPIYLSFSQLVKRIGRVHAIEARYTMNVRRLDEGWRASQLHAGGGVLVDLGYHYIDLIIWFFGLPDFVNCSMTTNNRLEQIYDTEDTAFIQFGYSSAARVPSVLGSLILSRVYPDRDESLIAYGTKGSVGVSRGECERRDLDGAVVEQLARRSAWPSALVDQLEQFAVAIRSNQSNGSISPTYLHHIAFIDSAYRSANTGNPANPYDSLLRFED